MVKILGLICLYSFQEFIFLNMVLFCPLLQLRCYIRFHHLIHVANHAKICDHTKGRAGTENAAFIAGLGAACRAASNGLEAGANRLCALRDRLYDSLCAAVPGLHLNGDVLHRLPNTVNVSFPKVSGAELLAAAPEIMASTGAACHVGGAVSHVLSAMGLSRERAMGAVRLSLGRYTTEEEIDRAAEVLSRAWRVLTE